MATWGAYAKLRMHTTHTLKSFRSQTKELGSQLRRYANKVCSEYKTKPLPGEAAAANRRRATAGKKADTSNVKASARNISGTFKRFNLKTYKIHALGDYADNIERFGPTDCFSTQQVCLVPSQPSPFSPSLSLAKQGELEHRRVKRFYKRTNKMRFESQIAKQERMERHYRKYITALRKKTGARTMSRSGSSAAVEDASPRHHYSVAKRDRDRVDLYSLSNKRVGDPALKVCHNSSLHLSSSLTLSQDFIMKLKNHLLARVLDKQYDAEPPTFTTKDREQLYIAEDRLKHTGCKSPYSQ